MATILSSNSEENQQTDLNAPIVDPEDLKRGKSKWPGHYSKGDKARIKLGNQLFIVNALLGTLPAEQAQFVAREAFGVNSLEEFQRLNPTIGQMQSFGQMIRNRGSIGVLMAREKVLQERRSRPGRTQTILTRRDV